MHTSLMLALNQKQELSLHNYSASSTNTNISSLNSETHIPKVASLQLVRLIQQNAIPLSSYFTALPRLFLLNLIEYVLTIIAAMCVGKHFRPLNDSYE